ELHPLLSTEQRQQHQHPLVRSHAGIEPELPREWALQDPHLVARLELGALRQLDQPVALTLAEIIDDLILRHGIERQRPYYLGSGELATTLAATRRDLRKVLLGALKLKIPLIIGSAGSARAKPHLEQTLAIIREIAREEGLSFRMGVLRA